MIYKIILLLLISFNVIAENKTLIWKKPTHRVNNEILNNDEIKGYTIFCYNNGIKIIQVDVLNVESYILDLPKGKNTCNMITIDTNNLKSKRSINKIFNESKPKEPTELGEE